MRKLGNAGAEYDYEELPVFRNMTFLYVILVLAMVSLFSKTYPADEKRGDQSDTVLIAGLNTADEIQMSWGQTVSQKKLILNKDPKYVSEGTGSLGIIGITSDYKGNQYLAAKIKIPPTNMERRRLYFDAWTTTPKNTQAAYVRLYNRAGETVASWNNWRSPFKAKPTRRFALQRYTSQRGFTYEKNVAIDKPMTDVSTIEIIIGVSRKGAPFDMYVDNIRMSKDQFQSLSNLTEPKKLYPNTALVREGKPNAVIIYPESEQFFRLAQLIQERIKEMTSTEIAALPQDKATEGDWTNTNTILLGNVNNNRAVVPLYGRYYTSVDDLYPGAGGFVIRTVHDPWGSGVNAIIIGGSDLNGVKAAAERFLGLLQSGRDKPRDTLIVKPLMMTKWSDEVARRFRHLKTDPDKNYIKKQLEAARDALKRGAHTGITSMIANTGLNYGQTGKDGYAELFKELVYMMYEHYLSKPNTYGGPWGMDADFTLYRLMPGWDLVEESSVLPDEDRLRITKIIVQFIQEACAPKARSVLNNERVRFNHQTFPALGLFYAGDYFKKYYRAAEADEWLDIADSCFSVQAKAFKPYEDCNGYQWLTLYNLMKYVLAKGDYTYFENGNARRDADFAILCMDNLGYQVPYGDTGSYQCWWTEVPFLRGALWFYKDGRYQYILDKKMNASQRYAINEYFRKVEPKPPNDLLGTKALPLDEYYYRTFGGTRYMPIGKTFDKVVMRSSFAADKQYLLLDGLSNGGHKHYDGNSICRITDRERIWLADNDYIKALPKYHNGVLIFNDGQSQTIPPFGELEHLADFNSTGFSETTLRDYARVDWHRNIIWSKENYFVVIDEMEAKEPSDYSFRAIWQTIGSVTLHERDGLEVEQKGKRFFIRNTPGPRSKLTDDRELGKNWGGYPYAKPVVHVLEQIADVKLRSEEQYTFFNLLYCSDEGRPLNLEIRKLGDTVAAISGGGHEAYIGIGQSNKELKMPGGLSVAADAFHITPQGYSLVGATSLADKETIFKSEKPVDVELNIAERKGSIIVIASGATNAVFNLGDKRARLSEASKGARLEDGILKLAVPKGHAEIAFTLESEPAFAERFKRGFADALKAAELKSAEPSEIAEHIAEGASELKELWSYGEKLSEYLLTNNAGYFEAIDTRFRVTCSPPPLEANVFSGEADGSNNLESLTDGVLTSTSGSVMWGTDQTITIDFDLKECYNLPRIVLKIWWADSSSKDKIYQLDSARIELSNDDFVDDVRFAGEIVDTDKHGNWGKPGYGPIDYELKPISQEAQYVRITLKPKSGTGIYISELEIWGNKEGLTLSAKRGVPTHRFVSLAAADVDGDGADDIIAGATNGKVYAIDGSGRKKWAFQTGGIVHSVCVADLRGDGGLAIIAGSEDTKVYAITPDGKELWSFAAPYYKRKPIIRTVFAADLDGDGKQSVIAGSDNWHYYAIDADGKEIWRYESVHGSTAGAAGDLVGDGKMEVIAGTEYYWWHCINHDGKKRWAYSSRTGPRVNSAAVGDVNGDGKKEVIFGGADTNIHVLSCDGRLMWRYNTGDEVTKVVAADIDDDGSEEIIAASMSFNVYAFKGDGKRIWRRDLGDVINDLAVVTRHGEGKPRIIAGLEDGHVYVLAPDGTVMAQRKLDGAVLCVQPANIGGERCLIVSSRDGNIHALR